MNFRAILFGAGPADPHHILRAQLIPIEGLSVHYSKIAEEPLTLEPGSDLHPATPPSGSDHP
jgi:hypothetical protein